MRYMGEERRGSMTAGYDRGLSFEKLIRIYMYRC